MDTSDSPAKHKGGGELRAWRNNRALSLQEFGKMCGVRSASIVSEWERGTRAPSFGTALAIERATKRAVRVEAWGFDRKTARRAA